MKITTRAQWAARPARSVVRFSPHLPPTGHWNGPTVTVRGATTWGHEFCSALVRGIQNFHMDGRGWSDIAYNWLICPHGVIYEGRGLKYQNGANGTNSANKSSAAICFIAGQANAFTEEEKVAFKKLVNYIDANSSSPGGAMGHRDHKSTECPGNARYRWIHDGMPVKSMIEEDDMFGWESHDERIRFVEGSYKSIVGRSKDAGNLTQGEVNYWVYVIALNPMNAFDFMLALHAEARQSV